ncbi:MAG: hypothetical protein WC554_13270 [Clostridia bacterium]
MTDNNNVFLAKITEKLKRGDFDKYLTIPFMTKELLLISIKAKFARKLESGGTPVLNDAEVKDCIIQAKETAAITCAIFSKFGFIERTDDGFRLTDKGNKMMSALKYIK